jgi:hypothetical protein
MPVIGSNQETIKDYLGPNEIGNVYLGDTLISNKIFYNNWTPVSQSVPNVEFIFWDANNNFSGSFDNNIGQWNAVTSISSSYSNELTRVGDAKKLIIDNPNYVNSSYKITSSYLNLNNGIGGGDYLMQMWVKPSIIPSGDNFIYRRNPNTNNINYYFDSDLNYIYWGADTRPTPRSYKLVSSSIDPNVWDNQWHNIAFHFQNVGTIDNITRRLYVDGILYESFSGLETNNLFFSEINFFLGNTTRSSQMLCESIVLYGNFGISNNIDNTVLSNYNNSKHLFSV